MAIAVFTSSGHWRRLYSHYLGAFCVYAVNSQLLDRAAADGSYYSGSPYDIPLIATVAWCAAASLSASDWDLKPIKFNLHPGWKKVVPRMAMLAILSLPVLGLWTVLYDGSPIPSRMFRLYTVLITMLILAGFVFLRQYFQDQTLIALLRNPAAPTTARSSFRASWCRKRSLPLSAISLPERHRKSTTL